jgi:hypothetical protein
MTKKARFIENLNALSESQKKEAVKFFTKHPNCEKHIDWDNPALTYQDFQKLFSRANSSARSIRRKAKTNPRLLFEKYNCEIVRQTDDFLIVVPLDWRCAVFFDSFDCGGAGARWCIGDKNNPSHWNDYLLEKNIFFLIFFFTRHPVFGKKLLIQYRTGDNECTVWLQNNADFSSPSGLLDLLRNTRKRGNVFYNADVSRLWYCHLLYEKQTARQLFFEFDIFSGIKAEPEMIHGISMITSFFRIPGEIKHIQNGGEGLLRICTQDHVVKGSVLKGYFPAGSARAVIPPELGITEIGDKAFYGRESLAAITLPDSVAAIGDSAFAGCKSLASVTISAGVTAIGNYAFPGCESLAAITLPAGLTAIGDGAFAGCESLAAITLPDGLTAIGNEAFSGCKSLAAITLPAGLGAIGDGAFYGCGSLTAITLPDGLTTIGQAAFSHCGSLTAITLPDSVAAIGQTVFSHCGSLAAITLPDSVTAIGDYAFFGCPTSLRIRYKNALYNVKKIENLFKE